MKNLQFQLDKEWHIILVINADMTKVYQMYFGTRRRSLQGVGKMFKWWLKLFGRECVRCKYCGNWTEPSINYGNICSVKCLKILESEYGTQFTSNKSEVPKG